MFNPRLKGRGPSGHGVRAVARNVRVARMRQHYQSPTKRLDSCSQSVHLAVAHLSTLDSSQQNLPPTPASLYSPPVHWCDHACGLDGCDQLQLQKFDYDMPQKVFVQSTCILPYPHKQNCVQGHSSLSICRLSSVSATRFSLKVY